MLNCNCFQEVDSVQWQRVEAVVLAMPHQGTWAENDIQCRYTSQFHFMRCQYSRDAFYSGSQEKLVYLPCIIGGTLADSDT